MVCHRVGTHGNAQMNTLVGYMKPGVVSKAQGFCWNRSAKSVGVNGPQFFGDTMIYLPTKRGKRPYRARRGNLLLNMAPILGSAGGFIKSKGWHREEDLKRTSSIGIDPKIVRRRARRETCRA